MDLSALADFDLVATHGGFGKASRSSGRAKATLSRHIMELELSLGIRLIERGARTLRLTEEGAALYERTHGLLADLAEAGAAASSGLTTPRGTLRISAPVLFAHTLMGALAAEYTKAYPDVRLDIRAEDRKIDLVEDGYDIAIRVMSDPPLQMVAHELSQVRYVICASTQYALEHGMPERLEDLPGVPLITSTVDGRDLRLSAYQNDVRQEIALNPTLASENFQFLREAILAGLGVGLVPDYLVASAVADQRIVLALQDWRLSVFGTRMFLLRMPGRYQTLAARTLIDFMIQRVRTWAAS